MTNDLKIYLKLPHCHVMFQSGDDWTNLTEVNRIFKGCLISQMGNVGEGVTGCQRKQ